MSGMSALWSNFSLGSGSAAARSEKQRLAVENDLKYLYSAFTKIPCLKLAPDRRARLIEGYEEFPFDTAVPLHAFKNLSALEITDLDFRSFYGWDRLADSLRSLDVRRAGVDDPADLLIDIVLDDIDKRRRRSSKAQGSPTTGWAAGSPKRSPTLPHAELVKSDSAPGSPNGHGYLDDVAARTASLARSGSDGATYTSKTRHRSPSPVRPTSSRTGSAHGHLRGSHKVKRSGSNSSHSSISEGWYNPRSSASNLLAMGILPSTKWRFLKHLGLSDNGLASISAASLAPLANTLHSLDLSSNLFVQIPDCLASLTALRALNLSNCMIDSLHSLTRSPLPAITALNLRGNRLVSLAGVERLYPLERLDLRDNKIADPTELARLTGIPEIREIWVSGNPFTKTHSNYRVTIFNLFRKTPGYTEDVLIDTSPPGYSERRQLVDRVAERPNVPVIKPPAPDYGLDAVHVNKVIDPAREYAVLRKERPAPLTVASDPNLSSARRRKTPRRRIVDLSTSDISPTKPAKTSTPTEVRPIIPQPEFEFPSPDPSPQVPHYLPMEPRQAQSQTDLARINTSTIPRLAPVETIYGTDPTLVQPVQKKDYPPEFSVSGEAYRKKIEALRTEVGNGWLSVLSEEGWAPPNTQQDGFGGANFSPVSPIRPIDNMVRANSQQAIHSGRTLG